ncbi:Uncharacterised protein [Acinetobacter baumannii]|nr:Uncharacterised protein [Acinetobacter baumannii]
MKLITPPMASVPYSAEAPSRSTSTRSMAAKGMVLRSTAEPSMALFARRRPLSSTRVLFAPIPRRSANEAPPVALPTERLELYTPWLPESRPISSSVLVTPCWRSSSARRTLIGTAVSASTRRIALPVTSIRCNWTVGGSTGACSSAAAALPGASCRASSRAAPSGASVWSDRCMVGASLVPVCPGMSVEPGDFPGTA